ncbi:MAG: metal ABC transporter permease [Alphaproteobacteria bacterium]|nr:metal ABC transporter permease [Alphaproteobacteria bacterium]
MRRGLMDDFLLRALIAGFGVAAVAGPLGAFVVWRRMAFFGGTLSHSALLGVALGFLLGINLNIGIFTVCAVVAVLLVSLSRPSGLSNDTLLGILAHASLAFGLIAMSFMENQRIDLMGYLFGDVLATTEADIVLIYVGGALVAGVLAVLWRPLLAATVNEELALVEGVPVRAVNLGYMLLLAVIVALAMKVVGILLVTSLIIIPAAAARRFASTPEQMAGLAALAGCVAVAGGLWGSMQLDTPSGPSIVAAAFVLFLLVTAASAVIAKR